MRDTAGDTMQQQGDGWREAKRVVREARGGCVRQGAMREARGGKGDATRGEGEGQRGAW